MSHGLIMDDGAKIASFASMVRLVFFREITLPP